MGKVFPINHVVPIIEIQAIAPFSAIIWAAKFCDYQIDLVEVFCNLNQLSC